MSRHRPRDDDPALARAQWSKRMKQAKEDEDTELVEMLREVEPPVPDTKPRDMNSEIREAAGLASDDEAGEEPQPRKVSSDAGAGGGRNEPPETFNDVLRRTAGFR